MNNFIWKKALGFGITIWLIMFAVVSALVGFKMYESIWPQIFAAVVSGSASYIFAKFCGIASGFQALGAGVVFVAVGVILDTIISLRFNPQLFTSWVYWFSYALVLVAPWVQFNIPVMDKGPVQN